MDYNNIFKKMENTFRNTSMLKNDYEILINLEKYIED